MLRCAVLLPVLAICLAAAPRWELQFFHDNDKSSLVLNDICFTTPKRGVAIGALAEDGHVKPVALVTVDGGATWSFVPTKEVGVSLFFYDETAGWMITESGLWFSDEGGRTWRRISKQRDLVRVYFRSRERGWAIGARKTLIETRDAGKTWTKMPVADQLTSNPVNTTFSSIDFMNEKRGMIVGRSRAPRRDSRLPLWMEPDPGRHPERPALSIFLETKDGGETWSPATSSIFGRISRVRLAEDGRGLALIEFDDFFRYRSEIVRLSLLTGDNAPSLRRERRSITDIALISGGPAFAAGFEPVGAFVRSPVPGRLKILQSQELSVWKEMPVDYRAVATRVRLAAVDPANVWAATDTGMILRLRMD
jgi:hypothetical protein